MKRQRNSKPQKSVKRQQHNHGRVQKDNNKNFKFIQRGKTMQDFHKKQQILEKKYRDSTQSKSEADEDLAKTFESYDSDEAENLLETLKTPLINREQNMEQDDCEHETNQPDAIENSKPNTSVKIAAKKLKRNNVTENNQNEKHKMLLAISKDTFSRHLDMELTSNDVEALMTSTTKSKKLNAKWPTLGVLNVEIQCFKISGIEENNKNGLETPALSLYLNQQQETQVVTDVDELKLMGFKQSIALNTPVPLDFLQTELLWVMNNYQDLYYPERTFENAEKLRLVYCLHALNHILKTRSRILRHNAKLTEIESIKNAILSDSYRDQGLTRPKILFVLPCRDAAYRVVNLFSQLLYGCQADTTKKDSTVINYDRFASDYTGNGLYFPKTNPKPEDYEKTFSGNTDDNFRIGMSLTKKCLKLYTDFYASDILIVSPLGLRTVIGALGSKDRDFDFLNSIELLIIDQAELLIAQNWENFLHIMEHMHLTPQSLRDTNFQRVRSWCLNGFSRFYRQTLFFASHELPEFRAFFNSKCCNYEGKVRISNPIEAGDIRNVAVTIPQVFQRIDVSSLNTVFDQRFKYFIQEVLPKFRSSTFAHCMIYIPSYFDYVRLRNYFKAETINCTQICEYTKKGKIARARDIFFHSGAHFLLYSERSHFFRRTRIKGIRHLIMYQLPQFPHFYSEMINLMHKTNQNKHDGLEASMSITILYTKYDAIQLGAVLSSKKATEMLQSGKSVHAFTAE